MPASLPENPDLDHLHRQARHLQRDFRAGDEAARRLVLKYHPTPPADPDLPLHAAQLVTARRYGFPSWPRLRDYLTVAAGLTRTMRAELEPGSNEDPADAFCRLACLTYTPSDGPDRWRRARDILQGSPGLAGRSIWAAAGAADVQAVRAHLRRDRALASAEGGPFRWSALMYLAYSRAARPWPANTPGNRPRFDACAVAESLVQAGADPNAGYLFGGLSTPFTVLTGLFGEGEQGPRKQPRHPFSLEVGRILLLAGAEANDGQALYNRMFRADNDHLELLYRYGLGRGDGGVWRRRLGDAVESPAEMLSRQLIWAIDHGFEERVILLVSHGLDVSGPLADGRSAWQAAMDAAYPDIARYLARSGAPMGTPTAQASLTINILRGDIRVVRPMVVSDPASLASLRHRRPDLVHLAETPHAVAALAELGFDLDARRDGATALHRAAWDGDLDLVRALLVAGADSGAVDVRFGATPLGWAEHGCQDETAALLRDRSVTTPPPTPH